MSGRFAGAERLGDRRRRRLATASEPAAAPQDQSVGKPDSGARAPRANSQIRIDPAPATPPPEPPPLPLARIVPLSWWKYALAALVALGLVGSLRYAAWHSHEISLRAGPGVWQLIEPQTAPLATALSSLLLLLSAQ
ncbi:MAG: hypothetical protein EHM42_14520, partial [Planctomycetaceae bacterium]